MLFYFTATGNSLYVAKALDKNIISIPQVIDQNDLTFEDEMIGIVCPVFGHTPPQMVQEFMKKANFKTEYFYIILTYGNTHGGAAELAEQIAKDCSLKVDYIQTIVMVDNFLPSFDMEEQVSLDKKVDKQISKILDDITNRKREIQEATEFDRQRHEAFLERMSKMPADAFKNMYQVTDDCIGCGVCTEVCPSACFKVVENKAIQNNHNCQGCMACIHHCPIKAIKLRMPEKNPNARYRHENITLQEIIKANNQH